MTLAKANFDTKLALPRPKAFQCFLKLLPLHIEELKRMQLHLSNSASETLLFLYAFAAFCGPHAITLKEKDSATVCTITPATLQLTTDISQRGENNTQAIKEGGNKSERKSTFNTQW